MTPNQAYDLAVVFTQARHNAELTAARLEAELGKPIAKNEDQSDLSLSLAQVRAELNTILILESQVCDVLELTK